MLLQQGIKAILRLLTWTQSQQVEGTAILIYHRASGSLPIELDLPPPLLGQQLAYLAETGRVITYDSALATLAAGVVSEQPTYVLTFDDGYLDFYTTVFPLLRRWHLPAILFITTGFVEEQVAYPMLSYPAADVKPVTWEMLGEMMASGLITVGAHTHTHPVLTMCTSEQVAEELVRPLELFQRELGIIPKHFCYPQARWNLTVESQVKVHYQSAVIGTGLWATGGMFDPYRVPRIPVRRSDGWRYFQAKVTGRMLNEEALYNWLRRQDNE